MSETTANSTGMLDPTTVAAYIASRPTLAGLVDSDDLDVKEVGDGNLNQVFICRDGDGRSIVLKQALPYVRLVGPDWPMSEDRATREAHAISVHTALSAEFVIDLIDYDPARYVLALRDLSDHDVLRTRFNAGGPHEGVAEALATYVADIGFGTSWYALGEEVFRRRAGESINTELCALTEDVIFTEPFLGADRNSYPSSIAPLVEQLQADPEWVGAAMVMKRRFITKQEALIHGDLHSGSVFVRGSGADLSVKAFDSEFAFYAPIGFDLGLMWANFMAAAARAAALGDPVRAASLLDSIESSWRLFGDRLRALWPTRATPHKHPDLLLDAWIDEIRDDALGFAGCEATRRIIGLAKLSDIESLPPAQYDVAAEAVLRCGAMMLVGHARSSIAEVTLALKQTLALP